MKLWILVGAFGLLAAPNALALDSLTDPPDTQDDTLMARVDTSSGDMKRKCAAQAKHDATPHQRRDTATTEPAPPRASEQQHAEQNAAPPPIVQDERRRRRNGSLEAIPDTLLLRPHGAL